MYTMTYIELRTGQRRTAAAPTLTLLRKWRKKITVADYRIADADGQWVDSHSPESWRQFGIMPPAQVDRVLYKGDL